MVGLVVEALVPVVDRQLVVFPGICLDALEVEFVGGDGVRLPGPRGLGGFDELQVFLGLPA